MTTDTDQRLKMIFSDSGALNPVNSSNVHFNNLIQNSFYILREQGKKKKKRRL